MPEKDTSYTREGTIAHAMAENILRHLLELKADAVPETAEYLAAYGDIIIGNEKKACEAEGFSWAEMAVTVYDNYCTLVYEAYLAAKTEDPEAALLIEARLKLSEFIPEGFGSSDAVIIFADQLEVFDLKYGKGVKVEAEHNAQMMCYALGAYCGPGETYVINNVHMTIIQPRLSHESSWQIAADDLLAWGYDELRPAAAKAFLGEGEQVPGDHCRFCKVAARCRKLADYTLDITKEKTEPGIMTLSEIAEILPHFSTIKSWISSVEEYALEAALEGDEIPGYKVVEGRSIRKLSDVNEVKTRLDKAGIPAENYLKPAELKSLTDLEAVLTKKGFKELLGDLVTKPAGKPALVPESDPRKPLSKAKTDFASIIETL